MSLKITGNSTDRFLTLFIVSILPVKNSELIFRYVESIVTKKRNIRIKVRINIMNMPMVVFN